MDNTEDNGEAEEIVFGDECDLHHFAPRDRTAAVEECIRQASEKGLRRIRIVHGKGTSTAKREVLRLLDNDPRVASYGNDGPNWGATVVILK